MGDSECSSGCESGWTVYLDNSCVSPFDEGSGFVGNGKCGFSGEKRREEEEEEDMSMVSDASSGPPHFPEEADLFFANGDSNCFYQPPVDAALSKHRAQKQRFREKKPRQEKVVYDNSSLLDDTASSPVFNLPNKNFKLAGKRASAADAHLDVSKGFSTTQFIEGSSAYQQQYGFFQSGNYLQQNQVVCRQNVAALRSSNIQQFAENHGAVVVIGGG